MKIAVLDYKRALLQSNAAKKYEKQADQKFGPEFSKLKKLENNGVELKKRIATEKLSSAERDQLALELRKTSSEFQALLRKAQESKKNSDQAVLKKLKPLLDKSVKKVVAQGDYDLVIDRASVVDVKPQYDITSKVIALMNKSK
ncbi:UNVERIFIED_CONTAM: hypothetical protein GTU68_010988 [Idotea baltica]|nr:hypothetical protein [Idotea baltica]